MEGTLAAHPSRNPVQTQAGLVSAVGVAGNAQNGYVETCPALLPIGHCEILQASQIIEALSRWKLLCLEDFFLYSTPD